MKAITVTPRWAWAIFHGKDIENRTWWRPFLAGATIAIHAGKTDDIEAERFITRRGLTLPPADQLVTGAVIGVVTISGAHRADLCLRDIAPELHQDGPCRCSPWAVGAGGVTVWHWQLADARPIRPVECRGALGVWELPAAVADAVAAQMLARGGAS